MFISTKLFYIVQIISFISEKYDCSEEKFTQIYAGEADSKINFWPIELLNSLGNSQSNRSVVSLFVNRIFQLPCNTVFYTLTLPVYYNFLL